ncbi:MAG: serine hydrolase domain-containing protein [Parvularculaceae bacterium]
MKPSLALFLAALSLAGCAKSRLIPPAPKSYYVNGAPVSAALQTAPEFSGVVMVGEKGETLFATAQGLADREARRPLSLYDSWRWVSVAKMATAILILQEVDKGRLSLDRTLAEQAPAFAGEPAGQATLREVLQQTAGAGDSAAGPGSADALITRLLEATSGKPLRDLFRERIAAPAGLRGADMATRPCEERVKGYEDAATPEPPANPAANGAAGALCGPPRALQAFAAAVMAGKLISPPMRAEMRKSDPALGHAGLGVLSYEAPLDGCPAPVALVERQGAIGGIETRLVMAPATQRSLVIFSNRADVPLGELRMQKGLAWSLASAAFCKI